MPPVTVSGAAAHTNANIGPVSAPFPQMDVWLREPHSSTQGRTATDQAMDTARDLTRGLVPMQPHAQAMAAEPVDAPPTSYTPCYPFSARPGRLPP